MNTKTLLVILAIMVGTIAISSSNGAPDVGNNTRITLSTKPDPLQPGPATFFIEVKDKSGKPVDSAKVFF